MQKNAYYDNVDDVCKDNLFDNSLEDQDSNSAMLDESSVETDSIIDLNTNDGIDLVADDSFDANQKQAIYHEQACYQSGKVKTLSASELWKTFNTILSNHETCTEQMKLVVSTITLSLQEITQTDRQSCGIFCHVDRSDVDREYALKQIVGIIKKT